jgi:hypothetical protein
MTTRVESEEIQQTTSEKVLAIALGIFIFIGGAWGYVKFAEVDPSERVRGAATEALEPEQQEALEAEAAAERDLRAARRSQAAATRELTLRREEYRTALEAGEPAGELRAAYLKAQERLEAAEAEVDTAAEAVSEIRPAANEARAELAELNRARQVEARESEQSHDRTVLLLRLALILGMAACALWLLARLRSRRSRYLPLPLAWLSASAILGIVLAADYSWGEFTDISDLGPLLLAVTGAAMSLAGFVVLERHIGQRLPVRRVRKRECPFCGFPAEGPHCEGCGRRLIGPCSACQAPRRVGTPRCAACGEA